MGKGAGLKRAGLILVCFLLLLPLDALADEDTAKDLTKSCTFTVTGGPKGLEDLLRDGSTRYACTFDTNCRLTIRADEPMGALVLRLSRISSAFVLVERDALGLPLGTRTVRTDAVALTVPLDSGCRLAEMLLVKPEGIMGRRNKV